MPRKPNKSVPRMVPVKEEESSSADDNTPVASNKRRKPYAASPESPPIPLSVILCIQRAWRKLFKPYTTPTLAKWFIDALTKEHVRRISFEALVVFLREKSIIEVAKLFVQRIHFASVRLAGSPSSALAPKHVNIKVVLAAYMIAERPTHVFETMGVLEQEVYESAIKLTTSIESIAMSLVRTGRLGLVNADMVWSFPTVMFEYLKRFQAWKIPDEAKLTCRIKHALVALYNAEQQLPPDEPEDSKLKIEFRTQIERLRSKLQQIAGASVLAEFDEVRKKGGPIPPPMGGGGVGGVHSSGGAYTSLPGRMTNEQMAHELLLDPMFQLSDTGGSGSENTVHGRIRTSIHQAFWDSLVDDIKLDRPCYVRVIRVLCEIRDGIAELAGGREATAIREIIDIELIQQQTESGAFGWENCKKLVGSTVTVIKRIQAPGRESATRERWVEVGLAMQKSEVGEYARVFCRALEFLLDLVSMLRVDAANARLRLIAPIIEVHGVDYERGKLKDKLLDGTITIDATKEWIKEALGRAVASDSTFKDALSRGCGNAFRCVHMYAMVALIVDVDPIKQENVPVTLSFDWSRLLSLQGCYHSIVDGLTVFTSATHAITSAAGSNQCGKQEVLADFAASIAADGCDGFDVHFVLGRLGKGLDTHGILADMAARTKVFRVLTDCVRKEDAVRQLIASRVRNALMDHFRNITKIVDSKLMSLARPLCPLLETLAARLSSLAEINRKIHTPMYNDLISSVLAEGGEAMDGA